MQLHYERVAGSGAEPGSWLYLLHGVFGAGRNWGSIARRLVRERPDWGALLVDLRQHGASQHFPPPHTVPAAAADLAELATAVLPPRALLGHSFGGKVALLAASLPGLQEHVRQLWIIDSTPAAREPGGGAWEMLKLLQQLPDTFQTRDQLIAALGAEGVEHALAQWMATNLHFAHGRYHWRFERDAMEDLLRSFFDTDAWPAVERSGPELDIHFVRATRSSVMDADAIARARRADAGRVHVHDVEGGHWLNADNPDSIVHLLVQNLPW
jgi:pimeloyl-ACP methyl ester carboxylesterase